MQTDRNSLSKWIVKSENKILGPYSYEQIEDLIRKKQISLIDEVRDSSTRWLYVRENPEFKDIVESIRKELDSKLESTKTFQSFSKTEEMAKTKTDVSAQFVDKSAEVKDITVVKEIIQNQQQERKEFFQEEANKREKVKLYGLEGDSSVKQNLATSTFRFLSYIGILFLVAMFSIGGFYFYQKIAQQKQEEQWTQQIKKYKFLGLDQKAVEVFGRLTPELQKKTLPDVIELLPLLESSGVVHGSEIDALKMAEGLNPEQRANLNLVQFWMAMQSQNFDLAQEFIAKATTLLPSSKLIKENDALLSLKKGRFDKALKLFSELYKAETSGRYLFGMVQAVMGLPQDERLKNSTEIGQTIEKYTYVYYDYKKELLLGLMLFAKWEKNDLLFQKTWSQFLSTPCLLSSFFKKPLLLAPNAYLWKDMSDVASQLRPFLNSEEQVLFDMHQLLETKQNSLASEHLVQNASKLKDNFVKQQLNMLLFHSQIRFNDVLALEKTNQLDMESELNQLILALDKLEANPNANIDKHKQFFGANKQLSFYKDWIILTQLMKQGALPQIKAFTRDNFLTVNNFLPALEAKSLVE